MTPSVIFGRNLIAELSPTVNDPSLVVTMSDLWPLFGSQFPETIFTPHFVTSIERKDLDALVECNRDKKSVVGLGGGQATDVAKYVAWRLQVPLFQVPTALSVNAPFAHRAAVRDNGVVKYVGFVQAHAIYIDFDVIQSAPEVLNRTGVGDIFCYHTAHADWRLAEKVGRLEEKWPVDETMIATARDVMRSCLDNAEEIRLVTEHGITTLVAALQWGGEAYAHNGWNPRPIEGAEHTFFYALEYLTKKHFLHGQPVGLGTILISLLQEDNDALWIKEALDACGVPYRPEEMGVTWEDCVAALKYMATYVEEAGLWYTSAQHYAITDEYLEAARELVYRERDPSSAVRE
jgi:glycerol dehydrogenase-like iron-containing ADH family enzyme